ncbi:hypothetical protein V8E53_004897 [Lactarius tabidus]
MQSLQNRLPSTQARLADDLLIDATKLLKLHREITNKEDYNMAMALLTRAKDFRHGLEKKSVIRRTQQSHLYLDKAHETLETIKQVTLEGELKIQGAVVSTVPTEREHGVTAMGAITFSGAVLNDPGSLGIPTNASTTASITSSAPIRGPTLQVVLDPPQSFSHSSPPDQPQEPAAPSNGTTLVPTGAAKETRPSINPTVVVSPLPTPPLTPETPEESSAADPTHFASPANGRSFTKAYRH